MAKKSAVPETKTRTPPSPLNKMLGAKFRALRHGQPYLYLRHLGAVVGLSQVTIGRIERAENMSSLDNLDKLARFYGTTLAAMLADLPQPPEDAEFARLRAIYFTLPEPTRAALLATLAAEKADAPPLIRPYDLRHSHASRLYAATKDLRAVAELLMHSNLTTTSRYAQQAVSGTAQAAVDAISGGTKGGTARRRSRK